jgi:hypothetical protein
MIFDRRMPVCDASLPSATRRWPQQSATTEVLRVINSSQGDLAPVFDAMLERAMRLCGFDHGSLQTYDGQLFRAVAVRGLPEQLAEQLRRGYHPELWPPTRPLVDGARLVHVPDLTQEEQVEGVRLAVNSGSRTLLFVSLRKDNALLGTIVAVRQEVRSGITVAASNLVPCAWERSTWRTGHHRVD